jgi:DNA modification methylase
MVSKRVELTFKYNQKQGRHGWVRLTPAYSVKLVEKILDENPSVSYVLDPFSGTGTTGLVCISRGLRCDLYDINPFLIWLARAKTANYSIQDLEQARRAVTSIIQEARNISNTSHLWIPPISNIHRWWTPRRLTILARIFRELNEQLIENTPVKDLLLVGFCRLVIQWSNAAYNHQSVSFKEAKSLPFQFDEEDEIYQTYLNGVQEVIKTAQQSLSGDVDIKLVDSRDIKQDGGRFYDCVITSPPYPNRMSYIRELRPYMYWLGYLHDARDAGELDWLAIGGTWGSATSKLQTWTSDKPSIPQLEPILAEIARRSSVLAHYVDKYFVDMASHLKSLHQVLSPGARLYYIIGNSKFYDTLVPVEMLYTDLMHEHGYTNVTIEPLRKRNSKKELLEFLVSCRKP